MSIDDSIIDKENQTHIQTVLVLQKQGYTLNKIQWCKIQYLYNASNWKHYT